MKVEEMDGDDDNEEDSLGFPIKDIDLSVHMKNIHPSFLPNFYGTMSEDSKTFLFEFEILCRSYGYLLNTQKLRSFLTTLKDKSLKWFMSLGTNSIILWNDMQNIFPEKYKYSDIKEEIFIMTQKEDESLEDLIERFMYNVKRKKLHHLGFDTLKSLLLRKIRDEWIDLLDLMTRGDVYQLAFEEICEICKNISRGRARVKQSTSRSVNQVELENLLDNFKTKILSNLSEQVGMLRMKNEQKEEVDICVIHAKSHATKYFPSLPRLKEVYQEDNGASQSPKQLCYVAPIGPCVEVWNFLFFTILFALLFHLLITIL